MDELLAAATLPDLPPGADSASEQTATGTMTMTVSLPADTAAKVQETLGTDACDG